MTTVKLNVQSLSALGMSRSDIEMIRFVLESAVIVEGAASANTPGAMVLRDASGNFSAGTITAALSGTATNAQQLGGTPAADYATDADVAATYAPLDGTGASGTWGIDISGNADTATDADKLGGVLAADYATQADIATKANASTTQILVSQGETAAMVAGSVSVSESNITANSLVIYSRKTAGGTLGHLSMTQTGGVGFTLTSTSATETSTIVYQIIEP